MQKRKANTHTNILRREMCFFSQFSTRHIFGDVLGQKSQRKVCLGHLKVQKAHIILKKEQNL